MRKGDRGEPGPAGEPASAAPKLVWYSWRPYTTLSAPANSVVDILTTLGFEAGFEGLDPVTHVFTAPRKMMIQINIAINGVGNGASNNNDFILMKNEINWIYMGASFPSNNTSPINVNGTTVVDLEPGDKVRLVFRNNKATAYTYTVRANLTAIEVSM